LRDLLERVQGYRVLAIADISKELATSCAKEWNIPCATTNYMDVIENRDIDAIFICTPVATHCEIITAAARRGKHIFCEKPLGLDLEQIDKALAAVKEAGIKLQVGFNRRFDPNFRRAKELIDRGAIGNPVSIRIISRDPDVPSMQYLKACGGLFTDTTIHDFDMARFLMSDEVDAVFAYGAVLVEPSVEEVDDLDIAVVLVRFKQGTFAVIENCRRAVYGYDQRVEIFGDKGMISVENRKQDLVTLYNSTGTHSAPNTHFFPERYPEAFIKELEEFRKSVLEDTPPLVTGEDGRIATALALAARRALETGRWVSLTEIFSGA